MSQVIVVDDNRDHANLLAECLRLTGHEVRIAYGGEAGLQEVERRPADALIVDLNMPVVDGFEVAAALAKRPREARPMLVALTANGFPAVERRAIEAGFDRFFRKPADIDALLVMLAER